MSYWHRHVKLCVVIKCSKCDLQKDTVGEIGASIESGGSIEIEVDPELPEGWTQGWRGIRCPEHGDGL